VSFGFKIEYSIGRAISPGSRLKPGCSHGQPADLYKDAEIRQLLATRGIDGRGDQVRLVTVLFGARSVKKVHGDDFQ